MSPFGFETISEDEFGEEFTLDSGEKKPYQQISLTLHDKQAEDVYKRQPIFLKWQWHVWW